MRLQAEQAKQYFVDNYCEAVSNFLFSCLDWDPRSRLTTAELLKHPYIIDGDYGGELEEIDVESVEARLMEEFSFEKGSLSKLEYATELKREMSYDYGDGDS